jgi:uncharacterized protein
MTSADQHFRERADCIAWQGVGLSVDAYSPNLLELYEGLHRAGLQPEYLEIFKAPVSELARIREALPQMSFAYHGEGLWLIDPAFRSQITGCEQLGRLAAHAQAIGAVWVNVECASKQFGGYSFGTYLPPVFTRGAADVTAENIELCQSLLDHYYEGSGGLLPPLMLIELPPLTYFAFGDMRIAEFFTHLAETAACGFVLDIGHLWTVWRYGERRSFRDLDQFLDAFLQSFPLHRVVEIHLAGIGWSGISPEFPGEVPWWVDAHHAPIPDILWRVLERIATHPGLTSLKGIALEVDTKDITLSIDEFHRLYRTLAGHNRKSHRDAENPAAMPRARDSRSHEALPSGARSQLISIYEEYARVISGRDILESSPMARFAEDTDLDGLARYTHQYLPAEILHWGGDLETLFPEIWKGLHDRGIQPGEFVQFWFSQPTRIVESYDFFNIKLRRWAEFVRVVAPELGGEVIKQVTQLLACHAELNLEPVVVEAFQSVAHSSEAT